MKSSQRKFFSATAIFFIALWLGLPVSIHADGKVAAWGNNYNGECILPNGLNNVSAIAAGYVHGLALKADGMVVGWGLNTDGQATPPSGLSGVSAIAAGNRHSLALRTNGTVVAWGQNYNGQANVPGGLTNVIAIAGGDSFSLALKADGTVVAWGYGGYGQINVPAGLSNVVAISAGSYSSLALKADGTVVAWGDYLNFGLTNVAPGLSNVIAISVGGSQGLALKADGTVAHLYGNGNIVAGLSNIVAVAAGNSKYLALTADGTVLTARAWGDWVNTPPISNATAIAIGAGNALAIVPDGPPEILDQPGNPGVPFHSNIVLSVTASGFAPLSYQWFFNGSKLFDSIRISGTTNAALTISNAQLSDAGTYRVIVSNAFGLVQSSGAVLTVISPPIITQQPLGRTVVAGSDVAFSAAAIGTPPLGYQWLLNDAPLAGETNTSLSLSNVQSANAGTYSAVASNAYGVLASSNAVLIVTETAPYILSQPTNRSAIIGESATFSVNARGTTPLSYQWRFEGRDIPGATNTTLTLSGLRLQDEGYYSVAISNAVGVTESAKASLWVSQVAVWGTGAPSAVTSFPPGLTNVVAVSAGNSHIVALKSDGTVRSWGSQLYVIYVFRGLAVVEIATPATNVPPGLSGVVAVSAGALHSLALKADGTVVAWGDNSYGQANVPPGLSNVVAIAAGANNSLALRSNSSIVAWGGWGQGSPPLPLTNVPPGLSNLTAIAAGNSHGMALQNDGRIVSWGNSNNVPANLSNVIAFTFGRGSSPAGWPFDPTDDYLALRTDGTVAAWSDRYVTLPDGYAIVAGLSNVVAIDGGRSNIMALRSDGGVYVSQTTSQPPANVSNAVAIAVGVPGIPLPWSQPLTGYPSDFYVAVIGNGSPRFTIQPASQTVSNGATVQFHARAVGVPPLEYQWQLNGANLPGATNADLVITNARFNDAGTIRVIATNALGSTTSSPATLTIPASPLTLTAPWIFPDGSLAFGASDTGGRNLLPANLSAMEVRASSNLRDWIVLTNACTLTNGALLIRDLDSTNYSQRFYRIIER